MSRREKLSTGELERLAKLCASERRRVRELGADDGEAASVVDAVAQSLARLEEKLERIRAELER